MYTTKKVGQKVSCMVTDRCYVTITDNRSDKALVVGR